METIKTLLQALAMAIVATIVVGTLSSMNSTRELPADRSNNVVAADPVISDPSMNGSAQPAAHPES